MCRAHWTTPAPRPYNAHMSIIGHGVDLVETARITQLCQRHGDRFLNRVFTDAERAYAQSSKRCDEHLAARFAAKEAVLKALGTGWRTGIAWRDVEVGRQTSGRPFVKLTGGALDVADALGVAEVQVSLTHTDSHAMASAIAIAASPGL